jgi:hypothetical protein
VSIFKRLLRPNAESVDRPGVDEISPAMRETALWNVAQSVPNTRTGRPGGTFRGSLTGPIPISPAPYLDPDPGPDLRVSNYNRARHGEGLFGIEPLIPEGEVG